MTENNMTHSSPTIWILEDDERQASTLTQFLLDSYKFLENESILLVPTESEYLIKLKATFDDEEIGSPHLIIADMMMPWAFIGQDVSRVVMPRAVASTHGFRRAGVRCWSALRDAEKSGAKPRAPFIFYTVLTEDEVRDGWDGDDSTMYVLKTWAFDSDTKYSPKDAPFSSLGETITQLTGWVGRK